MSFSSIQKLYLEPQIISSFRSDLASIHKEQRKAGIGPLGPTVHASLAAHLLPSLWAPFHRDGQSYQEGWKVCFGFHSFVK